MSGLSQLDLTNRMTKSLGVCDVESAVTFPFAVRAPHFFAFWRAFSVAPLLLKVVSINAWQSAPRES
jgi:hypothetical protein